MAYFVTYFPNLKYLFPALYFIIIVECYQNGKRFTFRQNDDILRASSIIEGDTDGKSIEKVHKMLETMVGIVGIVVTIISIIVTLISIVQTARKHKHQKQPPSPGKVAFDK